MQVLIFTGNTVFTLHTLIASLNTLFSSRQLFLLALLLAGTALRAWYGWHHRSWGEAPDQLAWELVLDEAREHGLQRYDKLVHYPHEGGTIISSWLGLFTGRISRFPSLSVAALLLDTLSRLIQLLVVRRYFDKKVFIAFGIWTVFALPSILPWGAVNYGLHSIAAFLPFVLLHLLARERKKKYAFAVDGLVLALSIWFCYDAWVLLPVYLMALFFMSGKWVHKLLFFPAFSFVLLAHLCVRIFADAGFHLTPSGLSSLRGEYLFSFGAATWQHITHVWIGALPGSSLLPSFYGLTAVKVRMVYLGFLALGAIGFVLLLRRRQQPQARQHVFIVLPLFILLYALSPFVQDFAGFPHYATYRHWAFILPFLCLFTIQGLSALPLKHVWTSAFLLLCCWGTLRQVNEEPSGRYMMREAGFAIGTKLGHDPLRISRMAHDHPKAAEALLQGVGWGMADALLMDTTATAANMDKLMQLVCTWPPQQQHRVMEGVVYAFGTQVNPRLDLALLHEMRKKYPEMSGIIMMR